MRRAERHHGMRPAVVAIAVVVGVLGPGLRATAQEPSGPQAVSRTQLQAAIDKLGDLDYPTRTAAARTVRRTAPAQAVTLLLQAV